MTAVAAAPRELDDSHLVLQHLAGDPQAFGALVDRYQTHLLNFVYGTIGDRDRAEDVVIDVFIRVYRHVHCFDRSQELRTRIYAIASRLAEAELRRRVHPASAPKELTRLSSR